MKIYALLACVVIFLVQVDAFDMISRDSLLSSRVNLRREQVQVGTRPANCSQITETVAYLEELLLENPGDRYLNRQLTMDQQIKAEICGSTVSCPLFAWEGALFDVLVFHEFTAPSSDIEGMLMVGGNASLTGYSVGEKFTEEGPSILVGGDLAWHTGRLYHGDLVYGGAAAIGSPILNGLVTGQSVKQIEFIVDWAESERYFLYTSNWLRQFSGLMSSGSYLKGSQHTMTCETLASLHELNIDSEGSVVVNVVGEECILSNIGIHSKAGCSNTIFNFPTAETLHISETIVPGCISAPNAAVTGSSGIVEGQVVFKSFIGSTQFNKCHCLSCPQ